MSQVPAGPPSRHETRVAALYSNLHPMDGVRAGFFHIGADVLSRTLVEWVASATDGGPVRRVLEIGCGAGQSTRLLARCFGSDVFGLDLTPVSLALSSRQPADKDVASRLHWVCADGQALPFVDACFDVVWSEEVFCHIPDRARLLNECRRVLRPGGCLVFEDWAMAEGPEAKRGLRAFHTAWRLAPMETLASYRQMLEAVGLDVLRVEEPSLAMLAHWERYHQGNGGSTFEGHLAQLTSAREQAIAMLGRRGYLEARQKVMIGRYIRRGWLLIALFLARKPA